jgi:hypothetical protein
MRLSNTVRSEEPGYEKTTLKVPGCEPALIAASTEDGKLPSYFDWMTGLDMEPFSPEIFKARFYG